jgi:hypothetical protein
MGGGGGFYAAEELEPDVVMGVLESLDEESVDGPEVDEGDGAVRPSGQPIGNAATELGGDHIGNDECVPESGTLLACTHIERQVEEDREVARDEDEEREAVGGRCGQRRPSGVEEFPEERFHV